MEKTENLVTISLERYDQLRETEKNQSSFSIYDGARFCRITKPIIKTENEIIEMLENANDALKNASNKQQIDYLKSITAIKKMSIWQFLKYRKQ